MYININRFILNHNFKMLYLINFGFYVVVSIINSHKDSNSGVQEYTF